MNRRANLSKRFRKVAWGRLYWNRGRNSLMQHMDSDDVCIVRDGTLTTHYKTLEAFVEDLEEWEYWESIVAEDMQDDDGDGDSGGNRSHVEVR